MYTLVFVAPLNHTVNCASCNNVGIVLLSHPKAETAEETSIIGTKGRIKILFPSHAPTALEVTTKLNGRGECRRLLYVDDENGTGCA